MRRQLFLCFVLVIIFLCKVSPANAQALLGPESVIWDPTHKHYLISNALMANIQVRNPDGTFSQFSSPSANLVFPRGITIHNGFLYVADLSVIRKFDLNNGNMLDTLEVHPDAGMNDITTDGSTYLFVSDMDRNKVYRINPVTKAIDTIVKKGITTPNGLLYETTPNRLLIVSWVANAPIQAYEFAGDTLKTVRSTSYDGLDGIASDGKGNYYISEWVSPMGTNVGNIYRFTGGLLGAPVTFKAGLSGPADIYYNTLNDTLVVPEFGMNLLTFLRTDVDLEPPLVDTAYATSYTKVKVIFNEAVNATATIPTGRYTGLGVVTAAINAGRDTVTLTLNTPLSPNIPKTLMINNIQDMANNTMANAKYVQIVYPGNGIEDAIFDKYKVNIYPNPVADNLNIDFTLTVNTLFSMEIYDITGKEVYASKPVYQITGVNTVSLNSNEINLENGLYLVKLVFGNETTTIPLTIAR